MRRARRELSPSSSSSKRRRRPRKEEDDNWLFSPQKRESYYSKSMNQFQKRTQFFLRNNYNRWSNNRYRNRRMDEDGIFNVDYEYTSPPSSPPTRRTKRIRRPPMSSNNYRQPPPRGTRRQSVSNDPQTKIVALPSSQMTIRNNDPYYQAISDTILTSKNNGTTTTHHNHNGTSPQGRTRKTLQSRRRTNGTNIISNETKPIYSVYPNNNNNNDDEYYQDLEDLYGKTTAQVINQFGEFLANVVSDDYDDNNDNDGEVKERRKKKRNMTTKKRRHWKDRVLNRVDHLLGLQEDSTYYNKWTDQLELDKKDTQEHVNALEYVQGKKKKRNSQKTKSTTTKEQDQAFWEQDGTLMSLFFGRSPSGDPLEFEVTTSHTSISCHYFLLLQSLSLNDCIMIV